MFIVRANAVIDGTNVGKLNSIEAFNNPKDASRYNSSLLRAFVDGYCGRGLSVRVDGRQPEPLSDVHVDDVGVNLLGNFKAGRRRISDVSVVGRWCRLDLEVVNAEAHREFPQTITVGESLVVADPSCSSFDGSTLLINDVAPGGWRFVVPKVMTRDGIVPRELVLSAGTNVPRSNWEYKNRC